MHEGEALILLNAPGASPPAIVDALLTLLPSLCMAPQIYAPAGGAACRRLLHAPEHADERCIPALWTLAAGLYGQSDLDVGATLAALEQVLSDPIHGPALYRAAGALLAALAAGASSAATCGLLLRLLGRAGAPEPVQELVLDILHRSQSWIVPQLDLHAVVTTLASEHLQGARPRLLPLIERCAFANPGAIDSATFARLYELYRDDPQVRYLLYYLAEHQGVPAAVRSAAQAACQDRFPLHKAVARLLRQDPCRVLVVQNIADAQGDELIRLGVLLEALLAANPRLEITLLTGRSYLYAHPRLTVVPIDDPTRVEAALASRYVAVVNCHEPQMPEANHRPDLEQRLDEHQRITGPGLLIGTKKGYNHFVYTRLELDGVSHAQSLGLNRQRMANIYETTFRLVAELGLPLRAGQQPSRHAVLANRPSEEAEAAWSALTAPNGSGRPVALFNPFGGGERLKGFIEAQFTWLAGRIGALCEAGWFVVIVPNPTTWGSAAHAGRLVERLQPAWMDAVAIAPDPTAGTGQVRLGDVSVPYSSYNMHLLTYFIRRADLIVTVEGWMAHAAYLLARPFRLMMPSYAYHADWHPYGRSAAQDVPRDEPQSVPMDAVQRDEHGRSQEPPLPGQPRKALLLALLGAAGDLGPAMLPVLRWTLTSPDRHLRQHAAVALGRFARPQVDAELLALLDDSAAKVRGAAAAALLDHGRGRPARAFRARATTARLAANQQWPALLRLGAQGQAALRRLGADEDPEINQPARHLLGSLDAGTPVRQRSLPTMPRLGAALARGSQLARERLPHRSTANSSPVATAPQRRPDAPDLPHRRMLHEAVHAARTEQAPHFSGAGIVTVAGGPRYFTCAWVLLTMLRRVVRCTLPIQLWYLGPDELSPRMIELLRPFDVEVVDALAVRQRHPARRLGGWECKAFAIAHSPFREVIFLDADNAPLVDPAFLLATPEYRRTGTLFWPDIFTLQPDSPLWSICGVPYSEEPAVESGQLVIDKARCWGALSVARHLNDHSDFYYQYTRGDAETFHLAWRMLRQPYAMPAFAPRYVLGKVHASDPYLLGCLFQRDFQGREVFHHRTTAKWHAWGYSLQAPRFPYQAECQAALAELRRLWTGCVNPSPAPCAGDHSSAAALERTGQMLYRRIGVDQRLLELLPGGRIGQGNGAHETSWRIERRGGLPRLLLAGEQGTTCALTYEADGVWRGYWLIAEHMPVEIIPLTPDSVQALRTTEPGQVRY